MSDPNNYPLLAAPHIRLSGNIDQAMYGRFTEQLGQVPGEGSIVVAVTTLGGDPEVARTMGEDIRLMRAYQGREFLFLGKVAVYSAGATLMSYFPRDCRFLTRRTRIMVHERIITRTINLEGPLRSCVATLKSVLNEIEHSILIEEEGFRALVDQSDISFEDVRRKAPENWYVEAEEARDLGLVLDVI